MSLHSVGGSAARGWCARLVEVPVLLLLWGAVLDSSWAVGPRRAGCAGLASTVVACARPVSW